MTANDSVAKASIQISIIVHNGDSDYYYNATDKGSANFNITLPTSTALKVLNFAPLFEGVFNQAIAEFNKAIATRLAEEKKVSVEEAVNN